jgi:hypothetical protein
MWWRLIGSALEHAAKLVGEELDFKAEFLNLEEEDEETIGLGDVLTALRETWGKAPFKAADVAALINNNDLPNLGPIPSSRRALLREFLAPNAPPDQKVSAKSVGNRLGNEIDTPINCGKSTLILKRIRDTKGGPKGAFNYRVWKTALKS